MTDVAARVYFKGLRLGDYRLKPDSLELAIDRINFNSAIMAASAFAWKAGANARYSCDVEIAFRAGTLTAETSSQFWDRLRTFLKNLKTVINPRQGVLSVVRDPSKDATQSTGAISAGSNVVVTVNPAVNWSGHPWVLVADTTDPTNYEIIALDSSNFGASTVTLDLTKSYSAVVDICRLEWLWTECWLASNVKLPTSGAYSSTLVTGVTLQFEGVVDPTNGGLT